MTTDPLAALSRIEAWTRNVKGLTRPGVTRTLQLVHDEAEKALAAGVTAPAQPAEDDAVTINLRRWVESLIAHADDRDGMIWVTKAEIVSVLALTAPAQPAPDPLREAVYIVFDGPPSAVTGRFIEAETEDGMSVGGIGWGPDPRTEGWWRLGPLYKAVVALLR